MQSIKTFESIYQCEWARMMVNMTVVAAMAMKKPAEFDAEAKVEI